MTTYLEFLRQGFDVLEDLTTDPIDDLIERVKQYRLNPNRLENKTLLDSLIAETSYYHYLVGKKIAQVQAIRSKLNIQLNFGLSAIAKEKRIKNTYNNRKEIETYALQDPEYLRLLHQIGECDAMESCLESAYKTLYMEHYALRYQTDPNNNTHMRINH